MSDNITDGRDCYTHGDAETRHWFVRQWKIWPERADDDMTCNIGFHYGGVQAFRIENDRDPEMSKEFAGHVSWLDKQGPRP